MAVVKELIRQESNGTISFGDYSLTSKTKKSDFIFEGDTYKVKTFKEITKLEKNELFVYESVPGTSVTNMDFKSEGVSFDVYGEADVSITLELEAETEYSILIDGKDAGNMKTNLGGKLTISVDLSDGNDINVKVSKH